MRSITSKIPLPQEVQRDQIVSASDKEVNAATLKALNNNRWNRGATARALGISRQALYDRMIKYGIPVNSRSRRKENEANGATP